MRINDMITYMSMLSSKVLSNSVNQLFKKMYGDQFREFVSGYQGLKGLVRTCAGKILTSDMISRQRCRKAEMVANDTKMD